MGEQREVRGYALDSNQMCLAYENQAFDKREDTGGRLHCTLVTGFLGSGKTTLVHHILEQRGDLRVAVLVNEYADIDIDSLLLNSSSINSSYNLPSVSLVNGCACCNVSGDLKEAVQKVVNSKHDFDYLVIETSGLADPMNITKALQGQGVQLDVIVTVVDVEALVEVLKLPIALQQLKIADIVLVNKCDLAALSTISDVEDLIEKETGGTKAIRCRFCKVPLDLVMDMPIPVNFSPLTATTAETTFGVLSHETISNSVYFRSWNSHNDVLANKLILMDANGAQVNGSTRATERMDSAVKTQHPMASVFSVTFHSSTPLSMGKFQNVITKHMLHMKGLLRAKGLLWLNENRRVRFVFHWSGKKRAEATFSGPWESTPATSLVFIGVAKDELDYLIQLLSEAQMEQVSKVNIIDPSLDKRREDARCFAEKIALDSRFKVHEKTRCLLQDCASDPYACVVFGLLGSPLRGIHEADLNGALMRMVNARGVLFLTAITSSKEDHLLQFAFDDEQPNLENLWNELALAATAVRARLFKDIHPCRCDLKHHH